MINKCIKAALKFVRQIPLNDKYEMENSDDDEDFEIKNHLDDRCDDIGGEDVGSDNEYSD